MRHRIWIYQADRFLNEEEHHTLADFMQQFVAQWKAHGVGLDASVEIRDSLFLILRVQEDQQEATGCSIDASVHAIQQIQQQLGLNFFNRQRVAYTGSEGLKQCSMAEFKQLAQQGVVDGNTTVFNNTITSIEEFDQQWETKAQTSWHKMLLNS